MFPLSRPLLPSTMTDLVVFEPRYLTMLNDLDEGLFGSVMIERGPEVGGGDVRSSVGVACQIMLDESLEDGSRRLVVLALQRLRVIEWLPDDPYPVAHVEYLDDPAPHPDVASGDRVREVLTRLVALLRELGVPALPDDVELPEDPARAAYLALSMMPVGEADLQRVLEAPVSDIVSTAVAVLEDAEELLRLALETP